MKNKEYPEWWWKESEKRKIEDKKYKVKKESKD